MRTRPERDMRTTNRPGVRGRSITHPKEYVVCANPACNARTATTDVDLYGLCRLCLVRAGLPFEPAKQRKGK